MRTGTRTAAALGALLAAAALIASACSSGPEEQAAPAPSPTKEAPTTCPLTGQDPPAGVDLERPAVVVKVEDSPAARPQSGLEHADLVFEEVVEGGITRFMAIYHCGDTKKVGPVRSARFDDPKLAKPFTRVISYSGANGQVERELAKRDMVTLDEDTARGALYRDPPGSTDVHSLFADTNKLRKLKPAAKVDGPTVGVFRFGDLEGKAKKAKKVSVNFTMGNTIEYRWQGNSWRRFEAGEPFFAGTGDQIAVPNVLIQEVKVNPSGITDSVGNPSPEITLKGTGRALLFRDGKVVKGTWRIRKIGNPPVYKAKSGKPMVFEPGPIWVELVPSNEGRIKGAISFK